MNTDIFKKENILFPKVGFKQKAELFDYIAKSAYNLGYVSSIEACYHGLLEREMQQTTGFQDGFAIPHCKNDVVIKPTLLVIKSQPIPWDSLDGKEIEVSFVLLISEKMANQHLRYLALIAKSLIDDEYRNTIKKSSDQLEIYKLIAEKLGV